MSGHVIPVQTAPGSLCGPPGRLGALPVPEHPSHPEEPGPEEPGPEETGPKGPGPGPGPEETRPEETGPEGTGPGQRSDVLADLRAWRGQHARYRFTLPASTSTGRILLLI